MPQAQSFYERHSYEGLILWFVMARIGRDLREEYKVPTELPPGLRTLVRKLDDRDWLVPSASWENDRDFFGRLKAPAAWRYSLRSAALYGVPWVTVDPTTK